jgi:hypothetical protein
MPDCTTYSRIRADARAAGFIRKENVAHVSHVALMFTVTMAYAVVKDFKDKCKGEYFAKYAKMAPWDVVRMRLFHEKTKVLGIRLDGQHCTFHRVCNTLTNQTSAVRKLSFEAVCQLDPFTLERAERAVLEVATAQGVSRVAVRSRALLIAGGAAQNIPPTAGGLGHSAPPPPPPPPPEKVTNVYIQGRRD